MWSLSHIFIRGKVVICRALKNVVPGARVIRKLSGLMEMFHILICVMVISVSIFVKIRQTIHLRSVHLLHVNYTSIKSC